MKQHTIDAALILIKSINERYQIELTEEEMESIMAEIGYTFKDLSVDQTARSLKTVMRALRAKIEQ